MKQGKKSALLKINFGIKRVFANLLRSKAFRNKYYTTGSIKMETIFKKPFLRRKCFMFPTEKYLLKRKIFQINIICGALRLHLVTIWFYFIKRRNLFAKMISLAIIET